MKRDIASEIKQLKDRKEFGPGAGSTERLHSLAKMMPHIEKLPEWESIEFYKYLPIASVACLESFTRVSLRSLIDKGDEYFENVAILLQRTTQKIDFDVLKNIHKNEFTMGELVSHLVPCNNLNDVNRSLTDILGQDFLNKIKDHFPVFQGPIKQEAFGEAKFEAIKKSIVRSFELRHIFCHETSMSINLDRKEIFENLKNCALFIDYASDYLNSLLYKYWGLHPETQLEAVAAESKAMEAALLVKLKEIKAEKIKRLDYPQESEKLFDETIENWKTYAESKARLKGSLYISATWGEYAYYDDKMDSIGRILADLTKKD